jgi:hypothetical protein
VNDNVSSRLLVVPIGIGAYQDPGFEELSGVDAQIEQVCRLLAGFGGRHIAWTQPMEQRGLDAVHGRLRQWAETNPDHNTLLYWIGHGWSNTLRAALAHAHSPKAVGIHGLQPDVMATVVAERQPMNHHGWAIVVVEACCSARFVELVDSHLGQMPNSPRRILLVGVSGEGATRLGRFSAALARCLDNTFRVQDRIPLWELARELQRVLRGGGGKVTPRELHEEDVLTRTLPLVSVVK